MLIVTNAVQATRGLGVLGKLGLGSGLDLKITDEHLKDFPGLVQKLITLTFHGPTNMTYE